MKIKQYVVILFLTLSFVVWGQSLTISGNVTATNYVTFAALTAGDIPVAVLSTTPPPTVFSNNTQSLKYSWRFGGDPDDPNSYMYGNIAVKSSITIPTGLLWTVKASAPTETRYGYTTGEKTLGINDQVLIRDIWSTMSSFWDWWGNPKIITNVLTHKLTIPNFADLHPTDALGQNITITYTLQ